MLRERKKSEKYPHRRSGVIPRFGTFLRKHDFAIILILVRYSKRFGSLYNPEPAKCLTPSYKLFPSSNKSLSKSIIPCKSLLYFSTSGKSNVIIFL